MFQEIGRVNFFYHSKQKRKKIKNTKKAKENKEEKRISPENELKK